MSNSFGLPERTVNELLEFFKKKAEIQKVIIYGSRAKGTYKNGSDIDFAIWITDEGKLSSIKAELEDLPTPYKFDVINYETLTNEALKNSIDTDGIEIYNITSQTHL